MKASAYIEGSEIVRYMTPRQILGFWVEICAENTLWSLNSPLFPHGSDYLIKTNVKTLLSKAENNELPENTLVLISDTFFELFQHAEQLRHLKQLNITMIVNKSYPILDLDFNSDFFNGFNLHFPICELPTDPYFSIDEILYFLLKIQKTKTLPQGPQQYEIFNPRWKYETLIRRPQSAISEFHTDLNIELYRYAVLESPLDQGLRQFVQRLPAVFKSEAFVKLLTRTFNSKSLVPNIYDLYKHYENALRNPFVKLSPLFEPVRQLWITKVYFPIEYQIRNRNGRYTQAEYEQMKAREFQEATLKRDMLLKKRQIEYENYLQSRSEKRYKKIQSNRSKSYLKHTRNS